MNPPYKLVFHQLPASEPQNSLSAEAVYFQLWEREQEHTKTRWSVTTFFISISFAILGGQYNNWLSTTHLLFYFCILYSTAVCLLWWGKFVEFS